jgi:hypothetical protein
MVKNMQNVLDKLQKLPGQQQETISFFWEQELDEELGFDEKLENSIDILQALADKAVNEHIQLKTIQKGFDSI